MVLDAEGRARLAELVDALDEATFEQFVGHGH
jgi:hypothetical protein